VQAARSTVPTFGEKLMSKKNEFLRDLKSFTSKLFSQLRIHSESEIRNLQLRQIKREQDNNPGEYVTDHRESNGCAHLETSSND